ncbi:GNAT family N-acetyltransferase [Candidatus Poribacteria bacterium]|nr:GNAT family N-acetyltransferase [Candidatus Poribacteria bacterium]MBT5535173.1 GNAT family N-acetyltransferase [Candidatus Poribacteria bacterium]MBT5713683.1 GNAT family N-acetyltransferase [Candidatus Poribacteria bacterium]MBT7097083.1 GNAT family N-acetyltransferase [Candidatus Poribacteria bacterium]MBT7809090.1 GNAT family N-acetyltransferase [Candidatus Poribacteria bacterium]
MDIRDLQRDDAKGVAQTAEVLRIGFLHLPDCWADPDEALEEVRESLAEDRISRVAVEDGAVVGWVGGIRQYDGHVWELHPLVVHPEWRGRGIGRALVADLEEQARARGGMTVYLGSDDHLGQTSLGDIDVYPDPLDHLAAIRNPGGHPYEFYQKCGYSVVGMLPDANGFGKPDIFLAKRIGVAPS